VSEFPKLTIPAIDLFAHKHGKSTHDVEKYSLGIPVYPIAAIA
jgi:hypothetical protein